MAKANDYSSSRRIMISLRPGHSAAEVGREYAARAAHATYKLAKAGIGQQFSLWFDNSHDGDVEADDALAALIEDKRVHRLEDVVRWYAN